MNVTVAMSPWPGGRGVLVRLFAVLCGLNMADSAGSRCIYFFWGVLNILCGCDCVPRTVNWHELFLQTTCCM